MGTAQRFLPTDDSRRRYECRFQGEQGWRLNITIEIIANHSSIITLSETPRQGTEEHHTTWEFFYSNHDRIETF